MVIKNVILLISLAGLLIIAKGIEKPFWRDEIYQQKIVETQKEGNYLPYRIRKVLWNQLVVIKTMVERSGDLLWFGNFFGLGVVTLWRGIRRKKWREVSLFLVGIVLISIEKDPNPGYYFWFLFPTVLLIWLK